ncbi:MAG TPA: hypothetical protein VGE74_32935 [Gemmata sp.]
MSRLLACLALAFGPGPALACINDVELADHEREFRSQYHTSNPAPPVASPEPAGRPGTGTIIGAGAVLLVGAAALTLIDRRARG